MKSKTLVVISSDPRTSPRPAEGIRIAAGVGTWRKTEVTLLLRGVAGHSLAEYVDDYIDEDNFTRYLPIVAELGRPIYLEGMPAADEALEGSPWKYETLEAAALARLYAAHDYFLHF